MTVIKVEEEGRRRDQKARSRPCAAPPRLFFEHERPPEFLIVDNAKGFSEEVLGVCREAGVKVMPIDPYTPQQNSIVERSTG